MTTETETTMSETYPWNLVDQTLDRVQATLFLLPTTNVEGFDRGNPEAKNRVVGVRIGALTMHMGISGGDAEIVAALDPLLHALAELRYAAVKRLERSPDAV